MNFGDICAEKSGKMNKYIGILLLFAVFAGCGEDNEKETMVVTGVVKGLKKGKLYLQHIPDSTLITLDSMEVNGDGNFSFTTPLLSPEVFYLYLKKMDNNDVNDRITFFGEAGTITINTAWNTFDTQAKIGGSATHKKLEEYQQVMSRFNKKNMEIMRAAYDTIVQKDSIAMDSIQKASNKNILRGYLYAVNFALSNRNSCIAPYIAVNEVPDANLKYLDSIYNSLSPEVSASKYGKDLKNYLTEKRKREE